MSSQHARRLQANSAAAELLRCMYCTQQRKGSCVSPPNTLAHNYVICDSCLAAFVRRSEARRKQRGQPLNAKYSCCNEKQ